MNKNNLTISQLVKLLNKAKKLHGDVMVAIVNGESGNLDPIQSVHKSHPFTGQYGCMDRTQSVDAIVLHTYIDSYTDLRIN